MDKKENAFHSFEEVQNAMASGVADAWSHQLAPFCLLETPELKDSAPKAFLGFIFMQNENAVTLDSLETLVIALQSWIEEVNTLDKLWDYFALRIHDFQEMVGESEGTKLVRLLNLEMHMTIDAGDPRFKQHLSSLHDMIQRGEDVSNLLEQIRQEDPSLFPALEEASRQRPWYYYKNLHRFASNASASGRASQSVDEQIDHALRVLKENIDVRLWAEVMIVRTQRSENPVVTARRTNEPLWNQVKAEVLADSKGGRPGQWSARKAQLAVKIYKQRSGGYHGPKQPDNSLTQWTKQEWRTKSGKPSLETGERYLPSKAIKNLSDAEYRATTKAKREGMRKGQQFVKQPSKVAKKVKKYRRTS